MTDGQPGRLVQLASRLRPWIGVRWLRPRRSLLPAGLLVGQLALLALHTPINRTTASQHCDTLPGCRAELGRLVARVPGEVAGSVGRHLLAAVAVYLVAAAATSLLARRVDLAAVAPWLFAPDDRELAGVAVASVAALLGYAAGTFGAAYTPVGPAILYLLYFPPLALVAVMAGWGAWPVVAWVPEPVSTVALTAGALGVVVALPAAEVLWLYGLGHGAVRLTRWAEGRSRVAATTADDEDGASRGTGDPDGRDNP